jgi:predicted DNA-binding transcriptional regulator AlpA
VSPATIDQPAPTTTQADWPKLIPQHLVYGLSGYTGVARATWFRSKAAGKTPKPEKLAGGGIYYRRADLDRWIDGLKSA